MKIAVIEDYTSSWSSYRTQRNRDDIDITTYSYKYTFYSDQKEIEGDRYRLIIDFIGSQNRSYSKEEYSRNEAEKTYDIENSLKLAGMLDCQIFEPGISPMTIFEHKSYPHEAIEHETLPVIKYLKLIKDESHWRGVDQWADICLDDDGNLVRGVYDRFKASTLIADRLVISYKSYDPWEGFGIGNSDSLHAIAVKGNEWGVIDSNGQLVVKHQRYPITAVYMDFCVVELNGNTNCMNHEGQLLLPFTSQELVIHQDRYAEVKHGALRLLYDLKRPRLILVAEYECIRHITDHLIVVQNTNGTFDIYDHDSLKQNDEIIEDVTFHQEEMIIAKTFKGWCIYDSHAGIIFNDGKHEYDSVELTDDGYICLSQLNHNNYPIYGLADLSGQILLPCYSDSRIKVFQNEDSTYYILKKYKKYYLCNHKGEKISSGYDFINRGTDGVCIAFNGKFFYEDEELNGSNGTFHALSLDGNVMFNLNCQFLYPFLNGYSTIKKDYRYGKVNIEGEIVIPPVYEAVGTFRQGLIAACQYGRCGYIDESNHVIIDFKYDKVTDFASDGTATVEYNGFEAKINTKGELVSEWERITPL